MIILRSKINCLERYFITYKPYKMISQFISPYVQRKLGELDFDAKSNYVIKLLVTQYRVQH